MKKFLFCLFVCFIPYSTYGQGKIQRPQESISSQKSKSISNPDGYINGHGYVDLGLPSKIKWATCNIGAEKYYDYGDHFAWGEIQMRNLYNYNNCKNYGSFGDITKNPKYDAPTYLWGSGWCLPSKKDFIELKNKCRWEWKVFNGHCGYKITGPNGKSIFLPASGNYWGGKIDFLNEGANYWSSTPTTDIETRVGKSSDNLNFGKDFIFINNCDRAFGNSIRPVFK